MKPIKDTLRVTLEVFGETAAAHGRVGDLLISITLTGRHIVCAKDFNSALEEVFKALEEVREYDERTHWFEEEKKC